MVDRADKLAALRNRFRARLAEELGAAERLSAGDATDAARKELRDRAHKLAGVSALMGCPRLGEIAKDIDRELGAEATGAGKFHKLAMRLSHGISAELEG